MAKREPLKHGENVLVEANGVCISGTVVNVSRSQGRWWYGVETPDNVRIEEIPERNVSRA